MGESLKYNLPKYLVYIPTLTLYEVLFQCKIKDCHTYEWLDGYSYRRADDPNGEVYSRPLESFDEDSNKWEIHYS